MQWGSLSNFLAMGGYGFYVWGAYGVTVILLVGEIVALRRRRAEARRVVRRLARAERGE